MPSYHPIVRWLPLAATPFLLAGCLTTPVNPSKVQSVPRPIPPITALPHDPILLPNTAISGLEGDGLSYFNKTDWNRFSIKKVNDHYVPVFKSGDPKDNSIGWGTGAVGLVTDGKITEPEVIASVREIDPQTVEFSYKKSPLKLTVKMVPYDVSGLPIKYFLRTHGDKPSNVAFFVKNDALFPAGSVAWMSFLSVSQNELFVTSKNGFTGSDTLENFTSRFTKQTPYCVGFIEGTNAQPIGLRFDHAVKKLVQKDTKGHLVEKAQTGDMAVWKTKPQSLFCQADATEALTHGTWQLGYINGTRSMVFSFPSEITPYSLGIRPQNAQSFKLAMAEIHQGKLRQVVPAILWLKDRPISDPQWRFNQRAAEAVDQAIQAALPDLKAWSEANETSLVKRMKKKLKP